LSEIVAGPRVTGSFSAAEIDRLRTLWHEGHSTRVIGIMTGRTKNAIVGKAHRLDLPSRENPIPREPGEPRSRPVRAPVVTLPPLPSVVSLPPLFVFGPYTRARSDAPPRPAVAPVAARYVPVGRTCQFPMWGNEAPTHVYCDEPAVTREYCAVHRSICYHRVFDRREMVT